MIRILDCFFFFFSISIPISWVITASWKSSLVSCVHIPTREVPCDERIQYLLPLPRPFCFPFTSLHRISIFPVCQFRSLDLLQPHEKNSLVSCVLIPTREPCDGKVHEYLLPLPPPYYLPLTSLHPFFMPFPHPLSSLPTANLIS